MIEREKTWGKYKMAQRHNGTNSRFVGGKKWNWKTSLSSFNALQLVVSRSFFVVRAFQAYVYTDVSSKLSQEAWILPAGEL